MNAHIFFCRLWTYCVVYLCLTHLFHIVSGNVEELYDTKSRTSDLLWTKYPERDGWEEVTGLSLERDSIRYHQVCNTKGNPYPSNWIRSPYIQSKGAKRAYIDVEFSMVKCEELQTGCSETFNLFYYESDSDQSSSTFPPWRENPYVKIDTIAAGERFSNIKFSREEGMNRKTWTLGPLTRRGFHLAAQDKGACMSLMRVRVYSYYCSNVTNSLANFPRTVAGNDVASLVEVPGKCVQYANATASEAPRYYCNSNGEWKVRTGVCHCKPGYQANSVLTSCEVCGLGRYKSSHGNEECVQCPAHSISAGTSFAPSSTGKKAASHFCVCEPAYYRTATEDIHSPCTKPPSEPTSVTFQVNQTFVTLNWSPPLDDGGRNDLYYNVSCDLCKTRSDDADADERCSPCGSTVTYSVPVHQKIAGTSLKITDLEPFSNYRFKIFAMNGVSASSETAPARALVLAVTPEAEPSAVVGARGVSTFDRNFTMSWSEPLLPNGIITKYQLMCDDVTATNGKFAASIKSDKAPLLLETENQTITVASLKPGHIYVARVRAATSTGYGPYSEPVTIRTTQSSSAENRSQSPIGLIIGIGVGVCILLLAMSAFCYYKKRNINRERMSNESTSDEKAPFTSSKEDNLIVRLPSIGGPRIYVEYPDPHKAVRDFHCEIDISNLSIEETIGQGEFGEVCRGQYHCGEVEVRVAVKRLKQGADAKDQLNFLKEASTMAQFSHPNVVQLKGVVTKSRPQMIVTEYMENGSLDVFLKNHTDALSMVQLLQMLKGIASGMRYLSSMKYVHRDLAARNILVNSDLVCKVSDFGLSRTLENDPHATYTTQGGKIAIRWTAPECIRFRQFTSNSDVWSYGIVMWEVMSYGEKPYWDMSNQEVIESIDEGYRLPAPYDCPVCLHQLMVECWAFDAKHRPTMNDIYQRLDVLLDTPSNLSDRNQEQPTTPTAETAIPISIPA